jgi:hypothetical protein
MLLHAGGPAAAPLPHPASATAIYLPRCGAPPTSPHWRRLACPPPMAEPDIGHPDALVVIWTEQMHQRHKLWACRSPPPSLAPAHGALHAPPASTPPPSASLGRRSPTVAASSLAGLASTRSHLLPASSLALELRLRPHPHLRPGAGGGLARKEREHQQHVVGPARYGSSCLTHLASLSDGIISLSYLDLFSFLCGLL